MWGEKERSFSSVTNCGRVWRKGARKQGLERGVLAAFSCRITFARMLLALFILLLLFLVLSPLAESVRDGSDLLCLCVLWPPVPVCPLTSCACVSSDLLCLCVLWPPVPVCPLTSCACVSSDLLCLCVLWPPVPVCPLTSCACVSSDLLCLCVPRASL